MATSASQHDDDGIHGINVTPLVDIMLVLLVVFMVCAKLIASQGVPMDLPKAASAHETQTVLTIAIDREGHVSADGKPVTDQELRVVARDALHRNKELRTVVQASAMATHGTVLHIVDELRTVGVIKIAFAAERK